MSSSDRPIKCPFCGSLDADALRDALTKIVAEAERLHDEAADPQEDRCDELIDFINLEFEL